jgi:hypothetical protein
VHPHLVFTDIDTSRQYFRTHLLSALTDSYKMRDVYQNCRFKVCFLTLIVFEQTCVYIFLKRIPEMWMTVRLRGWYTLVGLWGWKGVVGE